MFSFAASLLRRPCSETGHLLFGAIASSNLLGASSLPLVNVIAQRFKYRARKPIGSPRSRKKRYYVRVPTPWDPFELTELFWRKAHHVTVRKSIVRYLMAWKAEHYPEVKTTTEEQHFTIDAEFKQALAENDFENARVAENREARMQDVLRWHESERARIHRDYLITVEEERLVREEEIRKKKEIIKTLVTPENLDERIAYALDNPTSFDFCLDWRGKRTYGRPDPLRHLNMAFPKKDQVVDQDEWFFKQEAVAQN